MIINVKVSPRSSKNELSPISDLVFKAKVTAVPEKGRANDAVIELISDHFKIPKSKIKVKAGLTSRDKLIEIESL